MIVPRKITILIDKREQIPLLFPETIKWYEKRNSRGRLIILDKKVVRMPEGDYALEGMEEYCLVERKGSARELWGNFFTKDYKRSATAFERLTAATYAPYLLLDMSPSDFWRPSEHVPNPEKLFDAVTECMQRLNLRLVYAGNCEHPKARRILGEQVVRILMAHCYHGTPGKMSNEALLSIVGKVR